MSVATEHPFAEFIRQIGKGQKGRRDLTEQQAFTAMTAILSNEASATQIGAFLMLMRVKEECEEELIGFVKAIETFYCPSYPQPDIQTDISWSSYSGKRDESNWYVLAQLALSQSYRILVHGGPGHTPGRHYTESVYEHLDLIQTPTPKLNSPAYLALRNWAPKLEELISLRFELGLRSPLNSVLRLCSPVPARLQIMSVFHPRYAPLHQHAAIRLGRDRSLVFKGAGGEAEIRPNANTALFMTHAAMGYDLTLRRKFATKVPPYQPSVNALKALWRQGTSSHDHTTSGEIAIIETMTAVLMAYHHTDYQSAHEESLALWHDRDKNRLDIQP
ncbi:glycosyl transferase family protein [Umboniibacter marinipuniceus]|uniref:Anthranilate phosphoribosyltransferase n=1 Tax=Umboniibacter marinipuniceus TaxID=569599 RepID=A0A3M0APX6_9GAMM|nr:glycosyl transferase family protein [Umboniibacter marinipuniceus]RMA81072.1 anthranilate phosphoribosyltransferase [Umboniibacter marinipuniceus]